MPRLRAACCDVANIGISSMFLTAVYRHCLFFATRRVLCGTFQARLVRKERGDSRVVGGLQEQPVIQDLLDTWEELDTPDRKDEQEYKVNEDLLDLQATQVYSPSSTTYMLLMAQTRCRWSNFTTSTELLH